MWAPFVVYGPRPKQSPTCDEWQRYFVDEPYSPICPDLPYPDCKVKK